MKLTQDQMKELCMYGGELEVVDTDDEDLVNVVITIPMDRFTADHAIRSV